jgi:hypothetical protein
MRRPVATSIKLICAPSSCAAVASSGRPSAAARQRSTGSRHRCCGPSVAVAPSSSSSSPSAATAARGPLRSPRWTPAKPRTTASRLRRSARPGRRRASLSKDGVDRARRRPSLPAPDPPRRGARCRVGAACLEEATNPDTGRKLREKIRQKARKHRLPGTSWQIASAWQVEPSSSYGPFHTLLSLSPPAGLAGHRPAVRYATRSRNAPGSLASGAAQHAERGAGRLAEIELAGGEELRRRRREPRLG